MINRWNLRRWRGELTLIELAKQVEVAMPDNKCNGLKWLARNKASAECRKPRGVNFKEVSMSAGASLPAPQSHFFVFNYVTSKSMTRS